MKKEISQDEREKLKAIAKEGHIEERELKIAIKKGEYILAEKV